MVGRFWVMAEAGEHHPAFTFPGRTRYSWNSTRAPGGRAVGGGVAKVEGDEIAVEPHPETTGEHKERPP